MLHHPMSSSDVHCNHASISLAPLSSIELQGDITILPLFCASSCPPQQFGWCHWAPIIVLTSAGVATSSPHKHHIAWPFHCWSFKLFPTSTRATSSWRVNIQQCPTYCTPHSRTCGCHSLWQWPFGHAAPIHALPILLNYVANLCLISANLDPQPMYDPNAMAAEYKMAKNSWTLQKQNMILCTTAILPSFSFSLTTLIPSIFRAFNLMQ